MSEQVAWDIMELSRDDRFGRIWNHLRMLLEELQEQINHPDTPKDEREILVHVRSRLKTEVIDVTKTAQQVLDKKEQFMAGHT